MSQTRTLGVEEELQIIDAASWRLVPGAPRLLEELPSESFGVELQRSTVETNSKACFSLSDLRAEMTRLRRAVADAAQGQGLEVAAVGTAPLSGADDFELTGGGRYSRMQQKYRLLVDEQLICGFQVHVGVDDRDLAVRIMPRLSSTLPVLLALAASSPFWREEDSGYASMRTMLWRRWPTAGDIGALGSAADYDRLIAGLVESGVITDESMAYFDVRPNAHVPTVELRACDACPLVDDALLVAALFRAAVDKAIDEDKAGLPLPQTAAPLQRAAMWQAARAGLGGALLGLGGSPHPRPAADVVSTLVTKLRPYLEEEGDWETVSELSAATLARGASSERQRARHAVRGDLADVVRLVVAETAGRSEHSVRQSPSVSNYEDTATDEAVNAAGVPTLIYRPVFDALDRIGPDELPRRLQQAQEWAAQESLTFTVEGEVRSFPVDVIPRLIPAHDWSLLATGLTQRARALEMFLRDVYGRGEVFGDGVLAKDEVQSSGGWRGEGMRLSGSAQRAPVIGFDMVHDDGGWRVLEDNARVPSGVGYAVGVRRLMSAVMPELAGAAEIRDPEKAFALIADTLRGCSQKADAVVGLLSDGADNSAWYEHRLLAGEAGMVLTHADEIDVDGDEVVVGGRRIDVLYLRLSDELIDVRDAYGRPVGARIMELAEQGLVDVVNAPGNGVADDKSMFCRVPTLIEYYLGERPKVAQVPTYRCADSSERESTLDRLGELVTKPVGGYGGSGVLVGPEASRAELEHRRQEIIAQPGGWVAQELVALSTLPTLGGEGLEARHVDLRVFVYTAGTGPTDGRLADLALTRVAPAGSMVVNSSRGGGAKDTWILTEKGGSDGK
jgi:carboxylate-amine ligase